MTKILHWVSNESYLCLGQCRVSKDKVAKTEKDVTCKNCLRILARGKLKEKFISLGGTLVNSSLVPVVSAGD